MLPGMGNLKALAENKPDEKQISRIEAIISSMTPEERRKRPHHQRKPPAKRIAKGSGTSVEDVNRLLKQFVQMQEDVEVARRDRRNGRRRQEERAPFGHAVLRNREVTCGLEQSAVVSLSRRSQVFRD